MIADGGEMIQGTSVSEPAVRGQDSDSVSPYPALIEYRLTVNVSGRPPVLAISQP